MKRKVFLDSFRALHIKPFGYLPFTLPCCPCPRPSPSFWSPGTFRIWTICVTWTWTPSPSRSVLCSSPVLLSSQPRLFRVAPRLFAPPSTPPPAVFLVNTPSPSTRHRKPQPAGLSRRQACSRTSPRNRKILHSTTTMRTTRSFPRSFRFPVAVPRPRRAPNPAVSTATSRATASPSSAFPVSSCATPSRTGYCSPRSYDR